jgi:hypothetical protein
MSERVLVADDDRRIMAKREQQAGGAVSQATQEADRRDGAKQGKSDRMPTPEEERIADQLGKPDKKVAENYEEAIELGADVKGEGQID